MTTSEQIVAMVDRAVDLGGLNRQYAHVLVSDVLDLTDQLTKRVSVMTAELAVSRKEVEILEDQRSAARLYLDTTFGPQDPEHGNTPREILRRLVLNTLDAHGRDRKIACIKELRSSIHAAQAWFALGNPDSGTGTLGLKDAKDIIDFSERGLLYMGVGGSCHL